MINKRLAWKLAFHKARLDRRGARPPWAHLSFFQNLSGIKVAIDLVAASVYARAANVRSSLIIPSVVTAATTVGKQFDVGLSVKRIGVIGQPNRGKRVAERNPVGIGSVSRSAIRLHSRLALVARAITSPASGGFLEIFSASDRVATRAFPKRAAILCSGSVVPVAVRLYGACVYAISVGTKSWEPTFRFAG